jgi:NADH-quinone oxidoreductase subunit N
LFIGNITALYQQSFKRMLAFSSISHAGYMLFAIVALGSGSAVSVFIYGSAYSIASIIAFGSLYWYSNKVAATILKALMVWAKSNPFLALVLTIAMLSLAGIPLTAGFIGKFYMFSTAISKWQIWLTILAVINAIISIFYYFRVIIAMYFRGADRVAIVVPGNYVFVFAIAAIATVIIGIYPDLISRLI